MLNLNLSVWSFLIILLFTILPFLMTVAKASELYHDIESLKVVDKSTSDPKNDDLLLVQRIIKSYQYVSNDTEKRGKSMWQDFYNKRHIPIHQVFKNGQLEEAAAILRDPASSELFYGLDNLTIEIQPAIAKNAQSHAIICLDCLVRLGEAMGALGYYRPIETWKAEAVIDKLEKTLGQKLSFPNPYPNEYGLWTPRGIVSYRAPQALYQAWRIKELIKGLGNPRVLEIGAGVGRTAQFARQLGIKDYTIVDLPFTLLSSEYFLGTTLGADQVLLPGEKSDHPEKCIKFMTPDEYFASDEQYDLIINVDSLTEMDPSVAQAYWNKIESNGGVFLSINHDANSFTVQSILEKSDRIEQYDKKPYWMRKHWQPGKAYFEELVRFKH